MPLNELSINSKNHSASGDLSVDGSFTGVGEQRVFFKHPPLLSEPSPKPPLRKLARLGTEELTQVTLARTPRTHASHAACATHACAYSRSRRAQRRARSR